MRIGRLHDYMDYQALGVALRAIRLKRGLTQKQVADSMGVTSAYVSIIERGTQQTPIDVLEKYAGACGASLELLLMVEDQIDDTLIARLRRLFPRMTLGAKLAFAAAIGVLEQVIPPEID